MLQAAKIIGSGIATTGLIGAGVVIGAVFGALILGVAIFSSFRKQLLSYSILGFAFAEIIFKLSLNALILGATKLYYFFFTISFFRYIYI